MHGSEQWLLQYMGGSSNRFIVPVYQRNYEWKIEQCRQLYDDLVRVVREDKKSHFFGSIVASSAENGAMGHYLVIDGQQRLTTISLLLLALSNAISSKAVKAENPKLADKILDQHLIDRYAEDDQKLKLKTVKDDNEKYASLYERDKPIELNSNLTNNYDYFYRRILKAELTADQLYGAIEKLQIINIFLGIDDNAQLIFESLNSTGVDLSEGDKVRNYVLMGLIPSLQESYYKKYWFEIEKNTDFNVSFFLRDFLSIKNQSTPVLDRVYPAFKNYAQSAANGNIQDILEDLLSYSIIYSELISPQKAPMKRRRSMIRLNRFGATVTRPFFMEVLRIAEKAPHLINESDLTKIFVLIESYLLRRWVTDIPSNPLNKIFVTLHRDILRLDGSLENYFNKLNHVLLQKTETGIFPSDEMFISSFTTKRIYQSASKNQHYILERFENGDSKEYKDVWGALDSRVYTIEHVLPQTLSADWRENLGPNHSTIHSEWVDRVANLTLTAYNPNYSNFGFHQKKTMENGFLTSGIAMNLYIASFEEWSEESLKTRNTHLMKQALKLWPMAETTYLPPKDPMDVVSLADNLDILGKRISKFSLEGAEQSVESWADMTSQVIGQLYLNNPTPLNQALANSHFSWLEESFARTPGDDKDFVKISDGYLNLGSSNQSKLALLRDVLAIYHIDESDLLFFLRKSDEKKSVRNRYLPFWAFAIPVLREKTGKFLRHNPPNDTWITASFGSRDYNVNLGVTLHYCNVVTTLNSTDRSKITRVFNFLRKFSDELQQKTRYRLLWNNDPKYKTANVTLQNPNIGIAEEKNWDECVAFLAEGFLFVENEILPLLQNYLNG